MAKEAESTHRHTTQKEHLYYTSRSVKAPAAKERGYYAGRMIVGRKGDIAVNKNGRVLMVNLTPADIPTVPARWRF